MATGTTIEAPADGSDLSSSAKDNLDVLAAIYERENAKVSGMQLVIERISDFFGSPAYLVFAVVFIVL